MLLLLLLVRDGSLHANQAGAANQAGWLLDARYQDEPENADDGRGPFSVAASGNVVCVASSTMRYVRSDLAVLSLRGQGAAPLTRLCSANAGSFWAAGEGDFGLVRLDPYGVFGYESRVPSLSGKEAADLAAAGPVLGLRAQGSDGVLLVTTKALVVWEKGKLQVMPLRVRAAHAWNPWPGELWFSTEEGSVYVPTASGPVGTAAKDELPGVPLWLLSPPDAERSARIGEGWLLGSEGGLFLRREGRWVPLPELTAACGGTPAAAVSLPGGGIALATASRGVVLADAQGRPITSKTVFPERENRAVTCLVVDDGGDLWAAGPEGVSRVINPGRMQLVPASPGQNRLQARSIASLGSDTFVVSPSGVHRVVSPGLAAAPHELEAMVQPPALLLCLASHGQVLLGGGERGLWKLGSNGWSNVLATSAPVTSLLASAVQPELVYYITGDRLGVFLRQGEAVAELSLGAAVSRLVEGADGDLWITTAEFSVLRVSRSGGQLRIVREFRGGDGLPEWSRPRTVAMLGERPFLFTDSGILEYLPESGAFAPAREFSGFRGVSGVSIRDGAALWLLEDGGRSPLKATQFLAEVTPGPGGIRLRPLRTAALERFGLTLSRIQRDPATGGVWGIAKDALVFLGPPALGDLAPPGPPRVTRLSAEFVQRYEGASISGLSDLRVDGDPLVLSPETTRLRFEVYAEAALGEGVQTRLDGLDAAWSSTQDPGSSEYSGLRAGRYVFRARAVDRAGRTGPEISLAFEVDQVWYARWYAIAGYVVLSLGLLYAAFLWRTLRLRRHNEFLNRRVEERTRELALANAAKTEFLASISHEIRNPLNGVVGFVAMLRDAPLQARERQLAEGLAACARSLRRVFDEVLDYARLEAGPVSLDRYPVRFPGLLRDVAQLHAADAALRGCAISVSVSDSVPALLGDEGKIRTIISNFVANAVKYAPGSRIEITCSSEPVEDSEGQHDLDIQVADGGPGVPEKEQELIFRKFVRGEGAARTRESGAGLGLSNCRSLAELMGGGVGVESTPGGGATFFLRLRLPVASGTEARAGSGEGDPLAALRARGYALVVEDQSYNQVVARSLLEGIGFRVEVAATGTEAGRLIARGGFSVALIDWDIPGSRGDELAGQIRHSAEGAQVLILAVTAHDSPEIRERCLASGMDGFLLKPLDAETLVMHLQRKQVVAAPAGRGGAAKDPYSVFRFLGRKDPAGTRAAALEYVAQLDAEMAAMELEADPAKLAALAHRLRGLAALGGDETLGAALRALEHHCRSEAFAGGEETRQAHVRTVREAVKGLRLRVLSHPESGEA